MDKGFGREGRAEDYFAGWRIDTALFQGNFYLVSRAWQVGTNLSVFAISGIVESKCLTAGSKAAQCNVLFGGIVNEPHIILETGGRSFQVLDTQIERVGMAGYAVWVINKSNLPGGMGA